MSALFLGHLLQSTRKRITLADARRMFHDAHPELISSPERNRELLFALQSLETEGALQLPAKGSWEKFGNPPLPTFVQLVSQKTLNVDYSTVAWVPELGFWPELKPSQLETARSINEFLLLRRGRLGLIPIKERSLEIFGDEKKLDSLRSGEAVFGGRLQLSVLGAFQVPLPLPYRMADAPGKPVLVVENHDSYWSFGEWNQIARQYAAVVFGSGLAFRSSGRALQQVLKEAAGVGVEYLGDLDPAGVTIPVEFNVSQGSLGLHVAPATEFYAWLLKNGTKRQLEQSHEMAAIRADSWLGSSLSGGLTRMWQEGLWIPQESLGIEQLRNSWL